MLTRWDDFNRTFAALSDFRRQMDRLFDDYGPFFADERGSALSATSWPRMVIDDAGNELKVFAEVPGMTDKDVQLSLNRNVLTISGERRAAVPEGYAVHRQERGNYTFSRSFSLPCAVDPEKASAAVKDGILTVTLEKAAEARPRQITVKAS